MNDMSIYSIATVAALKLQGIDPSRCDKDAAGRTVFVFASTPELIAAVAAYRDDSLTVSARQYYQAIHEVKVTYLSRDR